MARVAMSGGRRRQAASTAMGSVVAGRGWQSLSLTQASLDWPRTHVVVRSVNHTQLYEGML